MVSRGFLSGSLFARLLPYVAYASPGLRLKNAKVSESLPAAIFSEGFRLQAVRSVEGDPSKIPESRIRLRLLTKTARCGG